MQILLKSQKYLFFIDRNTKLTALLVATIPYSVHPRPLPVGHGHKITESEAWKRSEGATSYQKIDSKILVSSR